MDLGKESLASLQVLKVAPQSLHPGNHYRATHESSVPVLLTLRTLKKMQVVCVIAASHSSP